MGLDDRDYSREKNPAQGGFNAQVNRSRGGASRSGFFGALGGGRRTWSACVILIVVCCAVFVVDQLLPKTLVQSGAWEPMPGREQDFADLRANSVPVTLVSTEPLPNGVSTVFLLPGQNTPPGMVDPLAKAEFLRVSPLRAYLQFTTAQAVWAFSPTGVVQGFEFWRFIGYGFLHVSLIHLALNMLGLWFFGPIVENRFGRTRFIALFIVSTIAGACLFLVLNGLGIAWMSWQGSASSVPGLLSNDPYTPLIGASGGVYGIILAAAWLRPNEEILLLFVVPMRLKLLAVFLIGVSVYTLLQQGNNAGGEAAHLGGALAGWWAAQHPQVLDGFFDFFGRHAKPTAGAAVRTASSVEGEVDRILDKIRDKGLGSLTERERDTLRNATDDHRKRDGRRN